MLRTCASSVRESPQQGRGVDDEFRFSPTIRAPIIPSIVARGDTALARAYSNASLSVILGVGYRQMTLLSLPTYLPTHNEEGAGGEHTSPATFHRYSAIAGLGRGGPPIPPSPPASCMTLASLHRSRTSPPVRGRRGGGRPNIVQCSTHPWRKVPDGLGWK